MKSEFGKGLTYCLGLFLAHAERFQSDKEKYQLLAEKSGRDAKFLCNTAPHMWFNGASDHLYELQWDQAPKHLRGRLRKFQSKCLEWGHGTIDWSSVSEKDVMWSIQEAKDLLRLIDKANGISVEKGEWE